MDRCYPLLDSFYMDIISRIPGKEWMGQLTIHAKTREICNYSQYPSTGSWILLWLYSPTKTTNRVSHFAWQHGWLTHPSHHHTHSLGLQSPMTTLLCIALEVWIESPEEWMTQKDKYSLLAGYSWLALNLKMYMQNIFHARLLLYYYCSFSPMVSSQPFVGFGIKTLEADSPQYVATPPNTNPLHLPYLPG